MLGVRRASLVRQMAFRQDSNESELATRHGHLAAPMTIPDSPRPQKDGESDPAGIVMPVPPPTAVKEPTPVTSSSSKESSSQA